VTAVRPKDTGVLDDAKIRNLIARIAHLADTGDARQDGRCFTPDARWDMPGAPRRGRADIIAGSHERRVAGDIGPGSATRHMVGTISVDVHGDTARARSYFQFFAQTTTTPQLRLVGQYDDEFIRSPDGWLLDHRRITLG
jgi:3-phenylpropionate/cinnamic acid dioxygenase small subunit